MGIQLRTGAPAGTSAEAYELSDHGRSPQIPAGKLSRVALMPVQRQEQDDMGTEREYSTQEAADLLGIASRTTIWEAYKRGDIRGRKQGRKGTIKISYSALVEYATKFGYPVPPEPEEN